MLNLQKDAQHKCRELALVANVEVIKFFGWTRNCQIISKIRKIIIK